MHTRSHLLRPALILLSALSSALFAPVAAAATSATPSALYSPVISGNTTITGNVTNNATWSGNGTISTTSVSLLDTDASHLLTFTAGSNLTANRTVSIVTGDAARTLTLTGNATLDQDTSTTGSPTFVAPNIGAATGTSLALSGAASVSGAAATDLTLAGGSTGASLVLAQGATASITGTFKGQTAQLLLYQDSTLAARLQYGPNGASSTGTGNTAFGVAAGKSVTLGTSSYNNTFVGANAGQAVTEGYQNTFVGSSSGDLTTTGFANTAIGQGAGYSNLSGSESVFVGYHAGLNVAGVGQNTVIGPQALAAAAGSSAAYNVVVGYKSMFLATTAQENLSIGRNAGYSLTTGGNNTYVGNGSGYTNQTGANNVMLGYYAGAYETASNAFYVDNQNRTNTAGDKAGALLYGTFNATPASQTLKINATVTTAGASIWTPDALSGAGAVPVTTGTTALTSTGVAEAITLANGVAGQIKTIAHDVDGGSMVLTPATKTGFSTVTFTNAGDTVTLQYFTTRGWMVIGSYGATVAP